MHRLYHTTVPFYAGLYITPICLSGLRHVMHAANAINIRCANKVISRLPHDGANLMQLRHAISDSDAATFSNKRLPSANKRKTRHFIVQTTANSMAHPAINQQEGMQLAYTLWPTRHLQIGAHAIKLQ